MTTTWTIKDVLQWTQTSFAQKGIDSPRLDAELLLARVLGQSRVYLYTHYDQPLTPAEREAYRSLVQRRQKREPVAYILGEREFYGRTFTVTKDVLVPRPETEHLVESVREWLGERPTARLLDVGTGSGAIAVSLALHVPDSQVVGTDVSAAALAVARQNAERLQAAVEWREGDLLAPIAGERFDVIAANLPYIAESEAAELMPDVREHEPRLALFGGHDGLDLLRRLIAAAPAHLESPGLLALEVGAGQAEAVGALMAAAGLTGVRSIKDLAGHARVVLGER